jgi:hypothetical protein
MLHHGALHPLELERIWEPDERDGEKYHRIGDGAADDGGAKRTKDQ